MEFSTWDRKEPDVCNLIARTTTITAEFIAPLTIVMEGYGMYPLIVLDRDNDDLKTLYTVRHGILLAGIFEHHAMWHDRYVKNLDALRASINDTFTSGETT